MKPLPKHLRPRYRYLAVAIEAWPDAGFDRTAFQSALWTAARALVGDAGSAAIDPRVLRFALEDGTGYAVVRVRRGEVTRGRAALACVGAVDGHPIGVRVTGVSGTVRACLDRYINRRTEATSEDSIAFENGPRRAVVRDDRLDIAADGAFIGATELDLGERSESE